jgi:hypothetical protein
MSADAELLVWQAFTSNAMQAYFRGIHVLEGSHLSFHGNGRISFVGMLWPSIVVSFRVEVNKRISSYAMHPTNRVLCRRLEKGAFTCDK